MAEQEDHPTWEGQLAAPMRAPDDAQPQQHWENHLPHDDAGYLLMDEQWHIIAANDHSALVTDDDVTRLVGRHAREALGAEALGSLQAYGTAIFTLENVEYTLTLTEFVLPDGLLRLARVQETQTTLERMLSTLVHEVRNPLTAMRALAQGLEEASDAPVSESAHLRAYTSRLIGEIDRLNRLLTSMAHVARPAGRPFEPLDLAFALNRVAAIFQPDVAQRGVSLRMQIAPGALVISADPDQIQQALVNLVKNAIEATPPGGTITLRARRDPRSRPMLQVEDTGIGMDSATIERAFHPHQTQFSPPTPPGSAGSVKPGSMGLGLLIVRSIVHQHHGRLRVTSAPGRGATISILFPRAEEGV